MRTRVVPLLAVPLILAATLCASRAAAASIEITRHPSGGAPPTVLRAVAAGFPVSPITKMFLPSANRIDVFFSEPVDPVTSQVPGNYTFGGPVPRTVVAAVLDGSQPDLVHLTLNSGVGPNAAFFDITVTGVNDASGNPIVPDGIGNVGSFFIQILLFQANLKPPLCRGDFAPSDSFWVEGSLDPLTFVLADNARMIDPNVDSVYTTNVPISMSRDHGTGKAEAYLSWKLAHTPSIQPLEPGGYRSTHLTSDSGASTALPITWADEPSGCQPPLALAFAQLGFQEEKSAIPNSNIAECRLVYDAPPQVAFLNVAVRLPGGPGVAWAVRNLFLPDDASAAPVERIASAFPLSLLGIENDVYLPSLEFDYRLSTVPLADADTTAWFTSLVWHPSVLDHPIVYASGRVPVHFPLPFLFPPGLWFPPFIGPLPLAVTTWIGCKMPNVELDDNSHPGDHNGCMPAACANSMKWLDDVHPEIDLPPDVRALYEQLSHLMNRGDRGDVVTDSTALVAKLDLIEAYGLPIRVKYQSRNAVTAIKSTSGLSQAETADATPESWPTYDWLKSEASHGEDIELGGTYAYWDETDQTWVETGGGHAVVLTGLAELGGKPWAVCKEDTYDIDGTGTVQRGSWIKFSDGGIMRIPGFGKRVYDPNNDTFVNAEFIVDGVLSESYDPTVPALPTQHTFSGYCQEFRRTIPPGKKLTITYPPGSRCENATVSELDRSTDPPVWKKTKVWNFNAGVTRQFVNNTDKPVTIAVHNDDKHTSGGNYVPFTVNLAMVPASAPNLALASPQEDTSPSNPDTYGGFSLGGTTGGPDEFGAPAGPSVTFDASPVCALNGLPGRFGSGVQQLTLTHPVPIWNVYWTRLGLHLVVSRVTSPGNLFVSCPAAGYVGAIPISQPGTYEIDLGTVSQVPTFSITLNATAGLDVEFDAIGVPSLLDPIIDTGVEDAPVPLAAGLWNLGPTPSLGTVAVRFDVPRRASVDVTIHDVSGRRIATMVSGTVEAGSYTRSWGGVDANGRPVPSGLYFCRLQIDGTSWITRLVLAR